MVRVAIGTWLLAAAPAFAESPAPDPNTRADAVLAYRQEAIHFGSSTSVHVRGSTASVRRELMIYQGEMNRRLSAEELVRLTDRRDLIREMEAKQRRGRILAITGVGLFAAGLPLVFVAIDRESSTLGIVSGVMGAGGLFLAYAGGGTGNAENMFSERTLYDLGAEYNRKLRARHRLGLSLAPYVRDDGGGVVAAGRF